MGEKRYMISDASKKLDLENHVLRYWEEELELNIPRNELGHRYYTEKELHILQCIGNLKQMGFQLKAIKQILPELEEGEAVNMERLLEIQEQINRQSFGEEAVPFMEKENDTLVPKTKNESKVVPLRNNESKLLEFETVMNKIIGHALQENNGRLGEEVGDHVSNRVIREMEYLMRIQEEKEEQRFKNLDAVIREHQKGRQEVAASLDWFPKKKKKKSKFFRRYGKKINL